MQLNPREVPMLIGPGCRSVGQNLGYRCSTGGATQESIPTGNKRMGNKKYGLRPDESSDFLSAKILGVTSMELKAIKQLRTRIAQEIVDALNVSGSSGGITTGSNFATCTEAEQGRITLEMILEHPNFTLDAFIAGYVKYRK